MAARPAETVAPEAVLRDVLQLLDKTFIRRIGVPLFRTHPATEQLIAAAHRFRAVETGGFLALAKDLVRVTADRIDAAAIQRVVRPLANETWRSLKSLEKYLGTLLPESEARKVVAPLFAVYDLRVGDAHLPSSDLHEAYRRVGVDPSSPGVRQGFQLLAAVVSSLIRIEKIFRLDARTDGGGDP